MGCERLTAFFRFLTPLFIALSCLSLCFCSSTREKSRGDQLIWELHCVLLVCFPLFFFCHFQQRHCQIRPLYCYFRFASGQSLIIWVVLYCVWTNQPSIILFSACYFCCSGMQTSKALLRLAQLRTFCIPAMKPYLCLFSLQIERNMVILLSFHQSQNTDLYLRLILC